MQQFLKSATREAGTQVIATELFTELFVAANDARPAFDASLGRVALPPLTGDLESTRPRGGLS
jgi:hypothetical protein